VAEMEIHPHLCTIGSGNGWRRWRGLWRSGGRGLGDYGETVSLREHGEGCGGNGASVFRLGEHGKSESERGRVSASVGVEVSAPTSRTRACSQHGGDGRARAPRGSLALRGRHDCEAVCRLNGARRGGLTTRVWR
jgi:hypothetical protein